MPVSAVTKLPVPGMKIYLAHQRPARLAAGRLDPAGKRWMLHQLRRREGERPPGYSPEPAASSNTV
jgi:hypothetical protein